MELAIRGGKAVRNTPFPARTPYGQEEIREVTEALMSQNLFYLPPNKGFRLEEEFAAKYGVSDAIACSSGTASIHLAVAALDAQPGDEMITCPVTDFGTLAGMIYQGLIPVFADWKEDTFNVDPDSIERNITERTKAVLVVHIFGNPCDMDSIMNIARRHSLPVIEDCCQAYCTYYNGRLVGTIGDIGCFSMQQSKQLTAGEGGITITNNGQFADTMRLFRDKGWSNREKWGSPRVYSLLGLNYRMNELTAAVALAQLAKVDRTVRRLNHLGDLLSHLILDVPGIMPAPVTPGGMHSYWLYPFRITGNDPQEFVDAIEAEGIPAELGYTVKPIYGCSQALTEKKTFGNSGYPFNLDDACRSRSYRSGTCPVAERELNRLGHIRIAETWSDNDIRDIAEAMEKVATLINGVQSPEREHTIAGAFQGV